MKQKSKHYCEKKMEFGVSCASFFLTVIQNLKTFVGEKC